MAQFSLQDFGAAGDGISDDTAAIQAWLNSAAGASPAEPAALIAANGIYRFTSALTIPAVNNISLSGSGPFSTVFLYDGVDSTIDLLTCGDGTPHYGWSLSNFRFTSNTVMTVGFALHSRRIDRIYVDNVVMDGVDGTRKLHGGFWFDDVQQGYLTQYQNFVQDIGIRVNGNASDDHGADLFIDKGMNVSCNVGIHVAGGFGGIYVDNTVNFGCGTSVLIDNAAVARHNREIFFGDHFVSDGAFKSGIHFNDTLTSNAPVTIGGFVGSSGVFGGTPANGIFVENWAHGRISVNCGQVFNCKSNGIEVADLTTYVEVSSSTYIFNNEGYGIYAAEAASRVSSYAKAFHNTNGNYGNIAGDGVWVGYTPAVSSQIGHIPAKSATGRYRKDRNTVQFEIAITITTNGTGAGALTAALPVKPRSYAMASGREIAVGGKMLAATSAASLNLDITNYDNSYPGVDGAILVLTGSYECEE
ncbi:glycosyl hydrolase family 28-related protein [Paenibacillus sp. GCM10027626]|uniref:glycosyl hydrolase family 28-related protein n=1 Tax=Paenibacillus sp. GCM10027626 TaxID=3273411 RepID=UPI00363C5CB1